MEEFIYSNSVTPLMLIAAMAMNIWVQSNTVGTTPGLEKAGNWICGFSVTMFIVNLCMFSSRFLDLAAYQLAMGNQ